MSALPGTLATNPANTKVTTAKASVTAPAKAPVTGRKRAMNVLWSVVSVLVFVGWMFPVYWMINISLQPSKNVLSSTPSFYPKDLTFKAFDRVINNAVAGTGEGEVLFMPALRNSLIVTALTLVIALFIGFLSALALTRFRFLSRKAFIIGILVIQMIPGEAMLVSLYKTLDSANALNNLFALSIVYVVSVLPFTIWTLRGFVNGIPAELEEAAQVDGCTRLGAFWKVTFPLLWPGLIATGVFAMIQAFNEFVLALVVMTKPSGYTLPVLLRFYQQATRATDFSGMMALSLLISVPVVLFFMLVQRRMTGGMVAGAVKG